MFGITLVHIKSQNAILSIGGSNNMDHIHCHRFCLGTQKWKAIENIKFPYYGGSAMLTKDEKHIIVTAKFQGGSDQRDEIGIIDIIDKDRYEIRMSFFRSPAIGYRASRYITMTDGSSNDMNEVLVSGYFRRYRYEILTDVLGIICMFYDDELLHCMRIGEDVNQHFVMPIQRLFLNDN